jgi:hypothetical protein
MRVLVIADDKMAGFVNRSGCLRVVRLIATVPQVNGMNFRSVAKVTLCW